MYRWEPMLNLIIIFLVSLVVSYAIIPLFRKLAIRTGYVDKPNERKKQKEPLPMLGGLAMALVFICLLLLLLVQKGIDHSAITGVCIGAGILVIMGLIDDYAKTRQKDFPAFPKLIAQIAAAYVLIQSGVVIHGINIPFGHIGYLSFQPI